MTRPVLIWALLWALIASAVAAGIVAGFLALAALALAPRAAGDVPVAATAVPAAMFVAVGSGRSSSPGWAPTPGPRPPTAPPQPRTPSPTLPTAASVSPVGVAQGSSPTPVRLRPAVDRTVLASGSESVTGTPKFGDVSRRFGIASTYGPGFDGYLALPAGPGIHVRICGAGGCIERVSNDAGPVPSLHRVADLSVADFEFVCGLPWTRGLCRVSVEVLP